MEKIVIKELEIIKNEMCNLEVKVDSFSRHNREPKEKERFEQIMLLDKWMLLNNRKKVLEDVLHTFRLNNAIHTIKTEF